MGSNDASSYKYQWARYVSREALETDFQLLQAKLRAGRPLNDLAPASSIEEFINNTLPENYTEGPPPKIPGQFKVGIVGAGCAGLFTAMILDHLNERIPELKMEYDILEAGDETRLGGRLYTHYFSTGKHDYVDIGAMRFPKNDIMKRTFQLFKHIGIEDKLIKYYMNDKASVDSKGKESMVPSYYNDVHHVGKPTGVDPYQVNKGLPKKRQVPEDLIKQDPGKVVDNAVKGLTDAFRTTLDQKDDEDPKTAARKKGWDLLMKADYMSTREYFRAKKVEGLPDGPGYDFNTTEWLETFAYATGWYNQSLAETVLEILDFSPDIDEDYKCIEGGTQQVALAMAKMLKTQPEFFKEVVGIDASQSKTTGTKTLTIKDRLRQETEKRDYYAIFNSTTLAALQRMDLTKAGLSYHTKQAIRSLGYGASSKVAMKFKTGWWMLPPYNIKGGIGKTDLPLRVCVYPSYNFDDANENCTLLCSYTWAQDAQRIGSLISPDSPRNESELLETLFHNLALLHQVPDVPYEKTLNMIRKQYITHYSYDWYADQNMSGAFAYFGPGQFSNMWPHIIKPQGWLFLVGEAASSVHAWIVGALDSAVRGVYQMLDQLQLANKTFEPYRRAMDLLEDPTEADANLPFGPLPSEMPRRQKGVPKDTALSNTPQKSVPLSFTTAQVILSYLESMAEQALAEPPLPIRPEVAV